jgi:hypothetical protein
MWAQMGHSRWGISKPQGPWGLGLRNEEMELS